MKFLLELILAELIFLFPAEKRSRFPLRLGAVLLAICAGQLLFPAGSPHTQTLTSQIGILSAIRTFSR